jgi:ABC-type uncharacterized transport system permease subunit
MYLLWLRVAAVLYAAGAVAVFPAALYGRERWRKRCVHLAGLGFFFHLVSAVEMLLGIRALNAIGVWELESLAALAVAAVFFLVWWIYDAVAFGVFALPMVFCILVVPCLGIEHYTFPSIGVRNGWLVVHVAALMAAYTALAFSLLASVLYLLQEKRLKTKAPFQPGVAEDSWWAPLDWMPPLDTLERIAQRTLEFGFPSMTVGLAIGSVLAVGMGLGEIYFRDPKVIASFAMWTVYLGLLFVRRTAGLRGRRAALLSGLVFLVMLVVMAANVISRVHRFGPQ